MDEADVDCASCGYAIRDFTNVVSVSCGHGLIHYNCSYFNKECSICESKLTAKFCSNNECTICESKLTADTEVIQFRPRYSEENLKPQLNEIVMSLNELKSLLEDQKHQQIKTNQVIEDLSEQLKSKDGLIVKLQKEVYEMKLEKVENLKKELQDKLNSLSLG